jgi:uncharacterized membrane protein
VSRLPISALPATLAATAVAAPALAAANLSFAALAIALFFSPVCHQDAARSFWLFGGPVAVCARCLGLYLGAAAGAWLRAPRKILLPILGTTAVLNLLDVLTELIGLHGNWIATRFVLGLSLGAALASLVAGSSATLLSARRPATQA